MSSLFASPRIRDPWLTALLLIFAAPVWAQVQVGDDLNFNLDGSISTSYSDISGNQIGSSHGLGFGGTAALNGFFYDPNFLSFNVDPYYNQSRANSNFGSLTNATGVSLSSAIFSGSHFPGSISFSKAYNSTGNYGLPGIASFDTNSNSQSVGITWSALFPNLPSLTVGYQRGSDQYSLYGTNNEGNNHFHSLFLNSNYTIAGFGLGGGISLGGSASAIPQLLVGGSGFNSNSHNRNYDLSVSHALPLHGSFSTAFDRANINSDYLGYRFDGTIDRWGMNSAVHPTSKLSCSISTDYTDNLSGSIYQAFVPLAASSSASSSTTPTPGITQQSQQSSAWDVLFNSTYSLFKDLQAQGEVESRMQFFEGRNYGSLMYSGGLSYTRQILGGYLGAGVTVIDNRLDHSSQNTLGFTTNTNYNRRFGAWQVGGYFNYSQNVQTLLVSYTTSFYNASGTVGRSFGALHWTAGASVGHSGLTAQPGSSSSNRSFNSSLGTARISLTGAYSKADGNSLAGAGGLVPLPVPPVVPSNLLVMYGGESYSVALTGSPVRQLSATASFVDARNTLNNQGLASWNKYEQGNFFLQYHFRQLNVTSGFSRLIQGFSASGQPAASVNSFSVGVSRWFNFF